MRKKILSITFAIIGAIILTNASVQAQPDTHLKANIPFDFYVRNEKLPAGEYSIKRLRVNSFVFQNLESKKSIIVLSAFMLENISFSQSEKLVFNLYGEEHFLSEIWGDSGALGHGLTKSKKERQTAKSGYWGKAKQPQKAEVALSVFRL